MTIVYSPFESEYGFKSPFFTVNNLGNIIANNVTLNGTLTMTSGIITLADLRISGTSIDSIGSTTLSVANTTSIVVGSIITSTVIPVSKTVTVSSIDTLNEFTVEPAIYMPAGQTITITDPDTNNSFNTITTASGVNVGDIRFKTPDVKFDYDINVLQAVKATRINTSLIKNNSGFVNIEAVNAPITLKSGQRVKIDSSPLNLQSFVQDDIDNLLPAEGDLVFNSETNDINYYTGTINGWRTVSTGDIRFTGATISAGTAQNVTITPQGSGEVNIGKNLNVTGDIAISNLPTSVDHATRKDYVDRQITALAIALGS